MSFDRTHYQGDTCPGGHLDEPVRLDGPHTGLTAEEAYQITHHARLTQAEADRMIAEAVASVPLATVAAGRVADAVLAHQARLRSLFLTAVLGVVPDLDGWPFLGLLVDAVVGAHHEAADTAETENAALADALDANTHDFIDGGNGLCAAMIQLPWQKAATCWAPPDFRLHRRARQVRDSLDRRRSVDPRDV